MIDRSDAREVAPALLAYLRETLGAPDLAFAEEPEPIYGGNRTFVYGFTLASAPDEYSGPLILRMLRSRDEAESAALEAAVQSTLVKMGYPAAPMLLISNDPQTLGGPFQVMMRVPGRSLVLEDPPEEMTTSSTKTRLLGEIRRLVFGPWPRLLAETQAALHDLDADAFRQRLEAEGFSSEPLMLSHLIERFAAAVEKNSLDGLGEGIGWLTRHLPATTHMSVCHGDFFPNQVFAQEGQVTGVIDWGDAAIAPAEVDVGVVKAGLETLAPPLGPVGEALQRWLARKYVAAYRRLRPIDASLLEYGEALRCFRTLLGVAIRRLVQAGAIDGDPEPTAYDNAVSERKLVSRFQALTGTAASIPALGAS